MVGLGGLEPPTSSLSGMRSSQLSYRLSFAPLPASGGAGRDRTGDLLSANQALSQLSYSPLLGRQRRLQRCRLINQSRPVGYRNHEASPWPFEKNRRSLSGDPERAHSPGLFPALSDSSRAPLINGLEWNGCFLLAYAVHSRAPCFRKLHPRSLLERR